MAKRIRMGLKKNTKAHRFVQNLPLASGRCSQLHLPYGRNGYELGTCGLETGFPLDDPSRRNFN